MFVSIYDKSEHTAEELGGKGFGLWWMQSQGVNVPPALILPTAICIAYMKKPELTMKLVEQQLTDVYKFFEERMGSMPLVSVRSGARVSMPGMMDTILNVGIDNGTLPSWDEKLGEHCAGNSYERLIKMYSSVVKGKEIEAATLPELLIKYDQEFGTPFPSGKEQLLTSIEAVFKSWNNERAKVYRKMNSIPEDWGTAVVIQAMVFGNLNDKSCTGVLFTRNPDTGEDVVTGEFLPNAQGEDVVAGTVTPLPLTKLKEWNQEVSDELMTTVTKLESLRGDVQDVEWTVQDGSLYILQTRNAKRSAKAAIRIALDMNKEGISGWMGDSMFKKVTVKQYEIAKSRILDPKFKKKEFATGLAACTGVATGKVVTSSQAAIDCKEPCILVTEETTPDDIAGMNAAQGILTMTGGMTSHAAVVARSMNKPCIVGLTRKVKEFEGKTISLDGATGRIWLEVVPVVDGSNDPLVREFEAAMLASAKATKIVEVPEKADSICLDLGYDVLNVAKMKEKVDDLRGMTTGQVWVDLTIGSRPIDQAFFSMFGTAVAENTGEILKMDGACPRMQMIAGFAGLKAAEANGARFMSEAEMISTLLG